MLGGLRGLLPAAIVAAAVFAAPAAASPGCSGGPSAVNVYSECLPSGSGKHSSTGKSTSSTQAPIPVPKAAARVLAHAGRDKRILHQLVTNPGLGATRSFGPSSSGAASAPSALGSAFDLGSGPTALLAVLAGTAVLLLAASGLRGWRRWRH